MTDDSERGCSFDDPELLSVVACVVAVVVTQWDELVDVFGLPDPGWDTFTKNVSFEVDVSTINLDGGWLLVVLLVVDASPSSPTFDWFVSGLDVVVTGPPPPAAGVEFVAIAVVVSSTVVTSVLLLATKRFGSSTAILSI